MVSPGKTNCGGAQMIRILILAAMAVLGLAPGARAGGSDGFFYETRPLASGVTLIFRPDPVRIPAEGNVLVIEQEKGLVVLDAGGSPPGGERIVAHIKKISPKPVRYLVYSHYHGDHNLGAGAFLKAWPGLTIISTAQTRAHMTGEPMAYIAKLPESYAGYREMAGKVLARPGLSAGERGRWETLLADLPHIIRAYGNLRAYPAGLTFTTALRLEDPLSPVELRFLGRANTDGDAVVWLPRQRIIATGDIVVAPVPYASASYPGEWMAVLDQIAAFDFAWLVPGHGAPMIDRDYLMKLKATLGAAREHMAAQAAKGNDYAVARKAIDIEPIKAAFAPDGGWDAMWLRSVFTEALLANAYKEAKGEPVRQGHEGG